MDSLRCPVCGTSDIRRFPSFRLYLILSASIGIAGYLLAQRDLAILLFSILTLLLAFSHTHQCKACGERWNAPEPRQRVYPPPDGTDLLDE